MPTIGLLGDVMLGRGVAERLTEVPPEDVWAPELREVCRECDLVICNLECCISSRGSPTERVRDKPFFFRGPPQATRSLQAIGVTAVGLANNHALDYESEALLDTLDLLDEAGIAVAGAGRDAEEARRPAVVEAGGVRVGLVAVSDHPPEFAAGEREPGIAHVDLRRRLPGWLDRQSPAVRERCDLLIGFPHWGPNMTTEPARWQRRLGAALQDGRRRPSRRPLGPRLSRRRLGTAWPAALRPRRRARRLPGRPAPAQRPRPARDLASRRSRGRAGADQLGRSTTAERRSLRARTPTGSRPGSSRTLRAGHAP